jgi:DNA-binding NarL/FixJ family response regulator
MMTIRVLLADDQDMVRSALSALIDRRPDLELVGAVADGPQAVGAAIELRPDVVVMDVRMPGMTGVQATERIFSSWPHPCPAPRILMLTTFDLDDYVHAALRAGASGFILKTATPEQLAGAIRAVAAGEPILAPTVTRRLIRTVAELSPAGPRPAGGRAVDMVGRLTSREKDVLVLLARGLSNARIGAELDLSEANVKSRVNRILTRLRLENRVQAALLAHEAGLIPEGVLDRWPSPGGRSST